MEDTVRSNPFWLSLALRLLKSSKNPHVLDIYRTKWEHSGNRIIHIVNPTELHRTGRSEVVNGLNIQQQFCTDESPQNSILKAAILSAACSNLTGRFKCPEHWLMAQ